MCSLVEAWRVGILILLDDGHDECDQLGPEVQVLDAGALLLRGDLPLLGLKWAKETLLRSWCGWEWGSPGQTAASGCKESKQQVWASLCMLDIEAAAVILRYS